MPSLSRVRRPTFKEFVVRVKGGSVDALIEKALQENIFAGVPLARWYPELSDCLLVAVTEKRTKAEIDRWQQCQVRDKMNPQGCDPGDKNEEQSLAKVGRKPPKCEKCCCRSVD